VSVLAIEVDVKATDLVGQGIRDRRQYVEGVGRYRSR
jgi:hypothetical protein